MILWELNLYANFITKAIEKIELIDTIISQTYHVNSLYVKHKFQKHDDLQIISVWFYIS